MERFYKRLRNLGHLNAKESRVASIEKLSNEIFEYDKDIGDVLYSRLSLFVSAQAHSFGSYDMNDYLKAFEIALRIIKKIKNNGLSINPYQISLIIDWFINSSNYFSDEKNFKNVIEVIENGSIENILGLVVRIFNEEKNKEFIKGLENDEDIRKILDNFVKETYNVNINDFQKYRIDGKIRLKLRFKNESTEILLK